MKANLKSLFFILAIAMPFLFTSCGPTTENGSATITFDNVTGTSFEVDTANFAITGSVRSEVGTTIDAISAYVEYEENGQTNNKPIAVKSDKVFTSKDNNDYTFRFDQTHVELKKYLAKSALTFIIEATVKNGETSKKSLSITIKGATTTDTPLAAATAFEWKREGGTPATGLEAFGLAWTSNTASVAIVKNDKATKFVQLDKAQWTSITTKEALVSAIEAATGITDYQGVSVTAGATYDDVLAVQYGEDALLIHVTKATIQNGTNGTIITITGESKK